MRREDYLLIKETKSYTSEYVVDNQSSLYVPRKLGQHKEKAIDSESRFEQSFQLFFLSFLQVNKPVGIINSAFDKYKFASN